MKKKYIIIGIIAIILVALAIFLIFNALKNKEKVSITADSFENIMKKKGYEIFNTTSQFANYDNYMAKSFIAKKAGIQIEFYELTSLKNAINMYNVNKKRYETTSEDKIPNKSVVDINTKHEEYSISIDGKYKYLSRIDNTFIYIDVDESYKNEVNKIMKNIGY